MTRMLEYQTNFASGEIDPTLRGQNDLKAYNNGAKRVRNMQRRSTGGLERRPGTDDLGPIVSKTRLVSFEFSNAQRYVVGFRNGFLDVWDLNGAVLVTLAAPWDLTQAFELTFTQSGDTMVICHQAFQTRVLKRTGASMFTLGLFAFDVSIDSKKVYQPYYKFEPATTTMTPSAATGAITVTCNVPFFTAAYVGQRLRIYDCEVLITGLTSSTVVSATVQGKIQAKLDLDPFKTKAGSRVVEVLHLQHGLATGATIALSGSTSCGKIPPSYFNGSFAINVLDDNRYEITLSAAMSYPVYEDLNQTGTSSTVTYTAARNSEDGGGSNVQFDPSGAPTRSWTEPAINAIRGWPGACAFHEGRLWLGGTISQPDGAFGSSALLFFRFDVGKGYDGDAVQLAIGSEDASRILHMVSNGDLQLFTATRESVFTTRDGEAITASNSRIRAQSDAGSGIAQPVVFDGATLFVQENGLSVSELVFSSERGGFQSEPVSTLAAHLIRSPLSVDVSVGSTSRAEQFAYFVNGDGTVAVFHSLRSENIAGWSLWTLGAGLVRSVACIGPYVFWCVEVRGAFRLYRQAIAALDTLDGQVHHVSGGAAKTAWVLDARVRSRVVALVSEKGYLGLYDVPASGAVTLNIAVTDLIAGDAFVGLVETLTPIVRLFTGALVGTIKRIVRSIIEFDDTQDATVDGVQVLIRRSEDDPGLAVSPLSGPYEVRHLGFMRNPTTVISQAAPLPMRVLGINQEVTT